MEEMLKLLTNAVLAYEEAANWAVEGGNDGGDVYEAECAWKEVLELAAKAKQLIGEQQ